MLRYHDGSPAALEQVSSLHLGESSRIGQAEPPFTPALSWEERKLMQDTAMNWVKTHAIPLSATSEEEYVLNKMSTLIAKLAMVEFPAGRWPSFWSDQFDAMGLPADELRADAVKAAQYANLPPATLFAGMDAATMAISSNPGDANAALQAAHERVTSDIAGAPTPPMPSSGLLAASRATLGSLASGQQEYSNSGAAWLVRLMSALHAEVSERTTVDGLDDLAGSAMKDAMRDTNDVSLLAAASSALIAAALEACAGAPPPSPATAANSRSPNATLATLLTVWSDYVSWMPIGLFATPTNVITVFLCFCNANAPNDVRAAACSWLAALASKGTDAVVKLQLLHALHPMQLVSTAYPDGFPGRSAQDVNPDFMEPEDNDALQGLANSDAAAAVARLLASVLISAGQATTTIAVCLLTDGRTTLPDSGTPIPSDGLTSGLSLIAAAQPPAIAALVCPWPNAVREAAEGLRAAMEALGLVASKLAAAQAGTQGASKKPDGLGESRLSPDQLNGLATVIDALKRAVAYPNWYVDENQYGGGGGDAEADFDDLKSKTLHSLFCSVAKVAPIHTESLVASFVIETLAAVAASPSSVPRETISSALTMFDWTPSAIPNYLSRKFQLNLASAAANNDPSLLSSQSGSGFFNMLTPMFTTPVVSHPSQRVVLDYVEILKKHVKFIHLQPGFVLNALGYIAGDGGSLSSNASRVKSQSIQALMAIVKECRQESVPHTPTLFGAFRFALAPSHNGSAPAGMDLGDQAGIYEMFATLIQSGGYLHEMAQPEESPLSPPTAQDENPGFAASMYVLMSPLAAAAAKAAQTAASGSQPQNQYGYAALAAILKLVTSASKPWKANKTPAGVGRLAYNFAELYLTYPMSGEIRKNLRPFIHRTIEMNGLSSLPLIPAALRVLLLDQTVSPTELTAHLPLVTQIVNRLKDHSGSVIPPIFGELVDRVFVLDSGLRDEAGRVSGVSTADFDEAMALRSVWWIFVGTSISCQPLAVALAANCASAIGALLKNMVGTLTSDSRMSAHPTVINSAIQIFESCLAAWSPSGYDQEGRVKIGGSDLDSLFLRETALVPGWLCANPQWSTLKSANNLAMTSMIRLHFTLGTMYGQEALVESLARPGALPGWAPDAAQGYVSALARIQSPEPKAMEQLREFWSQGIVLAKAAQS